MLYAEYVETPLRQRPCRNISQYHRPMQQQTGIVLCLPGCLLPASPTTAQHPYLTSIIVQVPELGSIFRPACCGLVTALARSLPRQSGAVLATNLVAACLRTTRFAHGQRTWMALEKHAGRSTETIPRAWERNASHLVLELGGLREERGCRLPVEQREHFGQQREGRRRKKEMG